VFNEKTGSFSESFTQAFISINLSQYPEQLIESELFGHTKGAFTGAVETHSGIFSRCSPCGAIFLDEIGDVSIPLQIKLLQVLQERFFAPVGNHKQERFQGRVIAATNKDVKKLREQKEFRDDFYYRLCSDIIEVPPLRRCLAEDPSEIDEILAFIIKRILGQASTEIVQKVKGFLHRNQPKGYAWPGNVRELEQCVRRVLLKNTYDWPQHYLFNNVEAKITGGVESGSMTSQEILSDYCRILYNRLGTYEAVAQTTQLDRRTVKKYIEKEK
jgi:transcriptional regulator with GAF, ATPase, and Fis domain